MMLALEIRRLQLRDLVAVEEIERRAYPTPWSRSMFAGEIAKPSSICLGAFDAESARLIGYLIVSRYVDASQADLHARFGGVVPEIASRRHLELVAPVVEEALDEAGSTLDDIELVAVTVGPGLIGALLVGLAAAKALAWGRGLPLAPVD